MTSETVPLTPPESVLSDTWLVCRPLLRGRSEACQPGEHRRWIASRLSFELLNSLRANSYSASSHILLTGALTWLLCFRAQIIRDSSPDLPTLLDDYRDFGGVCVFETIFG